MFGDVRQKWRILFFCPTGGNYSFVPEVYLWHSETNVLFSLMCYKLMKDFAS
jgi:hypothetical protein